MKKPTAAQLRQLKRDNFRWPVALAAVPSADWADIMSGYPGGAKAPPLGVWRSRAFTVMLWLDGNNWRRLSVCRTEWDERQNRFRDDIGWDDLQRLKAEAGFADAWAVEVYPSDDQVVNVANMRHLWLLPHKPPFAW